MRKVIYGLAALGLAAFLLSGTSSADDAPAAKEAPAAEAEKKTGGASDSAEMKEKAPETILMEKTGKFSAVKFEHKKHAELEKVGGCKACHEGDAPIFKQERSKDGFLMKDMYAGKTCGACHDGKKAFAAKTGCLKCHPKK